MNPMQQCSMPQPVISNISTKNKSQYPRNTNLGGKLSLWCLPQQPKPLCRPLVLSHSQTHLFVVTFLFVVSCLFFAERCAESEGERKILQKAPGSGYSWTSEKYPFECTGGYRHRISIVGLWNRHQHIGFLYLKLFMVQVHYVNRDLYSRRVEAKLLFRQAVMTFITTTWLILMVTKYKNLKNSPSCTGGPQPRH